MASGERERRLSTKAHTVGSKFCKHDKGESKMNSKEINDKPLLSSSKEKKSITHSVSFFYLDLQEAQGSCSTPVVIILQKPDFQSVLGRA